MTSYSTHSVHSGHTDPTPPFPDTDRHVPMPSFWHSLTDTSPLPPEVRDWVALETSMTARVGAVAASEITVDVLQQARGSLFADERGFFDGPGTGSDTGVQSGVQSGAQTGVVREVCLKAQGTPLLVARTVFTSAALEAHPTIVRLGNHALGSLLFANGPSPYTAREYIRFGPGDPLWPLVRQRHDAAGTDHYWARRTLFWLFDAPLLVTEIFLPELLAHPGVARL